MKKIIKIVLCIFMAIYPLIWIISASNALVFNKYTTNLIFQISYIIHPFLILLAIRKLVLNSLNAVLIAEIIIMLEYLLIKSIRASEFSSNDTQIQTVIFSINIGIVVFAFMKSKVIKPITEEKNVNQNPLGFLFKAQPNNVSLDNPTRGIYVQGGAGSGKSESFIKPIIKQAVEKNFSGVLYDFKSPELSHYLLFYFQKQNSNIKPYFVDFKNPQNSHRVNPLAPKYLEKSAHAFEYSEVIINNLLPETIKQRQFWDRDAQSILTGLIWYVKKTYPQYCTLPHIISLVLECDAETLMNKVSSDPEASGMVTSIRQAMQRGAEKQVAGVISTLQTALSRLNAPDVFWLLSGDDVDLNINDPENPKFLCLGNDSTLSSTYAPAISLIISTCARLMNQPNRHHSIIILDEAPTIYIPNFEMIPATARSNRVATVFGVQDYSQIVQRYGVEKAQVILANLGNQFFGRTSNAKTAEMIKSVFSKEDKTYWTKGTSKGTGGGMLFQPKRNTGNSYSQSIQERDKVKVSTILNSKTGQFFGIVAEGEPREIIEYQFDYDKTSIPKMNFSDKVVSKSDINSNYSRIISESKGMLLDEVKPTNNLISL